MAKKTTTPRTAPQREPAKFRTERAEGYPTLERLIARRVLECREPLYLTEPTPVLSDLFVASLSPKTRRQHYNCNACRRFIDRYGALVTVDGSGNPGTLLWSMANVPDFFREAVANLQSQVVGAKVVGVFLSSDPVWGTPATGGWTHLSGTRDPSQVWNDPLRTADQAMAEKKQDYVSLRMALSEFPLAACVEARNLLSHGDSLDRSEKALGVAEWLVALHRRVGETANRRTAERLTWQAVATAPPGFCHVKSTMIGTLLSDLAAQLPMTEVVGKWNAKVHPSRYQRPVALKQGTVERAEVVAERLGIAPALERRFATLDDVLPGGFVWGPAPTVGDAPKAGGVFGHLRNPKPGKAPAALPVQNITWRKLRDEVLPGALSVEARVPMRSDAFFALATAQHHDAPPLLQWDGMAGWLRNPVSWFFYDESFPAQRWNLNPGDWVKVTAVLKSPAHWQACGDFKHQPDLALLVLENCRDNGYEGGGAFFPECLRSEFHAVRGVMEAHARSYVLAGLEKANACGIGYHKGVRGGIHLRVRTESGTFPYLLDRWD